MKGCKRCATNVDSAFVSEQDVICQSCQENLKKNLSKCEEWEVKKKKLIEKLLAEEGNDLEYAKELHEGGNTYKICQKCGNLAKKNDYGDVKPIEHKSDCPMINQQTNPEPDNKSNQIKSNQSVSTEANSKPNYLPWILGGVGVLGLVGVLVYFLTKKNKKSDSERRLE